MFDNNAICKAHVAAANGCPDIMGELHTLYFCGHLISVAEARFSLQKARRRTVELLAAIDAIEADVLADASPPALAGRPGGHGGCP